jgi:hypothetical protein
MERLRNRDLRALLTTLDNLRSIDSLEAFPNQALNALKALIPAVYLSYNQFDSDWQVQTACFDPVDANLPEKQEVFLKHRDEHPLVSRLAKGGVHRLSDAISRRDFHRLALYNEYYKFNGTECQIAFSVEIHPGTRLAIAFNRDRPDFTEREHLLAATVRPHLTEILRRFLSEEYYRTNFTLMLQATDADRSGRILVDRGMGIRMSTPRAQELMEKYLGRTTNKDLPARLRDWLKKQVIRASNGHTPPLIVGKNGKRLMVQYHNGTEGFILIGAGIDAARGGSALLGGEGENKPGNRHHPFPERGHGQETP